MSRYEPPTDEITRLVALTSKLDTEVTQLCRQVSDIEAKMDMLLEAHYQRAGIASIWAVVVPAVVSAFVSVALWVIGVDSGVR